MLMLQSMEYFQVEYSNIYALIYMTQSRLYLMVFMSLSVPSLVIYTTVSTACLDLAVLGILSSLKVTLEEAL